MAYSEMSTIERYIVCSISIVTDLQNSILNKQIFEKYHSNHLLFLILNIPLMQHSWKSLFALALEQKRIHFLNNDRVAGVINHLYQDQFLEPEESIIMKQRDYSEVWKLLITQPFKFYFTGQGYQWVSGTSFLEYLVYTMVYAYFRRIDGANYDQDLPLFIMEILLWIMNLGYISFEVMEFITKGCREYFNVGIKGQAHLLDILISVIKLDYLVRNKDGINHRSI